MVGGHISTIATYCAVSATLTAAICCYARTFGRVMRLVDRPDGTRKLHELETPLIGGLALLIPSFGVSIVYLINVVHAPFMMVAVAAAAFTLVVGLIDDVSGLSPVWRVVAMTFVIFAAFSVEPIFVLHTLRLGIIGSSIPITLGVVAAPITALIILGFANASNMADGMNGQLLGSVIVWSLFISLHLGIDIGLPFVAIICSAIVTVVFNLRGKLFSGSSGAYAVSLFVALGAIAAYRLPSGAMPAELPILWFWLPVVDCVRLMITRLLRGKSPFAGDRSHFHHKLHDYMRMRYALVVYLVFLAAPGVVAEFSAAWGGITLLVCISSYVTFTVVRHAHLAKESVTAAASPSLSLPAAASFPVAAHAAPVMQHRRGAILTQPKPALALQDGARPTETRASA